MKAKMIVIDALDGVGKTTTGQILAEELGGVFWNTPGPVLRKLFPQINSCFENHQLASCLLYAASVLSVGKKARQLVNSGTTVVIDRYWLSTISYARARGVHSNLNAIEEQINRPDISIILELEETQRQDRLFSRGMTSCDIETLESPFRNTIWQEMRKSRKNGLGPTHIVNTTNLSPQKTCQEIIKIIANSLSK